MGARPERPSGELAERVAALVRVSARLAVPDEEGWREALRAANRLATRSQIEEVLLQAHLFVGFPVVLNAFIAWTDELDGSGGREDAGSVRARGGPVDATGLRAAGESLCRTVYGPAYERLRENVRSLSSDLDLWMVEDGYGKTLSRPGLDIEIRELCIVGLLAAGGHDRQLRAHLFGALNVGATPAQVEAALREGLAACAPEAHEAASGRLWEIWEEVRRKVAGRSRPSTTWR